MAKKKGSTTGRSSSDEPKRLVISIYPDEQEAVSNLLEKEGIEVTTPLNSRDIRKYFGLKPTHRSGLKTELRKAVKDLSQEETKELLEEIKQRKAT